MMEFETVESWKERLDLTDEDVLTPGHLHRVATQGPAQESEIVYCACGCGEFWLRPVDHVGRKQRYVRGHGPRRTRKTKAEVMIIPAISPIINRDRDIIQAIYNALPDDETCQFAKTIALLVGISREDCIRYLEIIDLILSLQSGHWLEKTRVIGVKDVIAVYRRKPRKRGERKEGS